MNPNIRRLLVGALLATTTTGTVLGVGVEAASAASTVNAPVRTTSGPLNVRSGPSTQTAAVGQVPSGAVLSLVCQTSGQYVRGAVRASSQWDRLTDGRWVAHAYMQTNAYLPSCAALDAPASPSGASVRTESGPLNVRSQPTSRAALTSTIPNGAAVNVTCYVNGETVRGAVRSTAQWDRLAGGGYVSHGYVQTGLALPSCEALDAPAAPAPAPANPAGASVRTDGGPLNVRSQPSSQGDPATTIPNGAGVNVTCYVNGETVRGTVRSTAQWDRLAGGGYVSHAYVQTSLTLPACEALDAPAAPAPVTSPTPTPTPTPVVTPAPTPAPTQPATYDATAKTEGGPLNIRSAPSASASVAGQVANGGALTLTCAVSGTYINGAVRSTSQWDRLVSGNYVSHAYVETSASLPTCAGGA
ncbi:hypothetical protein HC028_23580, partial [Planosporangium flavigriseum]|nr:hypothetical protein [Planosporangium flavigriseum]